MRAFLEFALFAWVAISVVAVVVQLIRLARFKRSQSGTVSTATAPRAEREAPTIDLDARLAGATPEPEPKPEPATVAAQPTAATADAGPAPTAPVVTAPTTPVEPPIVVPAPVASSPATDIASAPAAPAPSPTLADLLSGVRLPGNLLPAADATRAPSDDRVVLLTDQGEPGEIGADVADELERLGYTITTQGEDTAIATRGDHRLGLRIVPDPINAEVDGVRRFPNATASSVALDVWIDG